MKQHFCLIGGGVIGCSAALELAAAGARVTLIERGILGGEASWAGAGLLSALLPWQYSEQVNRLVDWGRALYPAWSAELQAATGIDPEFIRCGMLVLPPFEAGAASDWAHAQVQPVEWIRGRERVPALASDGPALWLPEVAQVRNPRLLRALRAALQRAEVTLVEQTPVQRLVIEGERVVGVETPNGRVIADDYVVAGGAWSAVLLGEWAPRMTIKPMRGQIVLLKGAPGRLSTILYREGLYVIPRADGHILIGSTLEDVGFDKSVTEFARTGLLAGASALLPWLAELPVVAHWAGLRPGSPDNIPIIDRHPLISNLYLSAGHYRYGVTMAPASAKLLADRILGRESAIPLAPYAWT